MATKTQKEIVGRLETLTGLKLEVTFIGRRFIIIEVPDTNDLFCSTFYAAIERTCRQYGLAESVGSGGYRKMALTLTK
jgi:hypothetical protein